MQHPRGSVNHWFVPVAVGERLAGFFLFDSRLRMERYSSFLRGRDEILPAPELGSWTDLTRIRARGVANGPDFEALGEPYLTYDGSVDRLAWALPVRSETDTSLVYIAGDFAYTAPKKPETTG